MLAVVARRKPLDATSQVQKNTKYMDFTSTNATALAPQVLRAKLHKRHKIFKSAQNKRFDSTSAELRRENEIPSHHDPRH
jgi:hypothetical protein